METSKNNEQHERISEPMRSATSEVDALLKAHGSRPSNARSRLFSLAKTHTPQS